MKRAILCLLAGGILGAGAVVAGEHVHGESAQQVPVYAEADTTASKLVGRYAVDNLRVVCGYGANGLQVVTVVANGQMGYAPVSDENCK